MKIKDFFKRIFDLRLIKTKIQPQKNSSHLNRCSSAFERGRSMIEMLGVLVIMGLLSVGGIWGYQYAMNAYHAGQIQEVMAQAKALTVSRRTASEEALLTFLDKTAVAGFNPTVGIAETADANGRVQRVYTITLDSLNESIQPILYARKPNFAKMDIMLAPSADAVEETDQSKESWVDAGMSEGGYDILQQYATLKSSSLAMFSFTTHLRGHMVSDGGGDDPSAQCPADKPFYDDAVDSCSQCDPTQHSYWDPVQATCVTCSGEKSEWDYVLYSCICPSSKPVWDEGTGTCVACLSNGNCYDPTPFCNPDTNSCEGCPGDAPVWDSSSGTCVGCLTESDCAGATPICNPTTNECVGCPSATPVWDSSTGTCVECTTDSHCADNTDGRTKCNTTDKICETEEFCPNVSSYKFATEESARACAENCPDRFVKDTYCYKCSGPSSVTYDSKALAQSECASQCPGERYVYNNYCYRCNYDNKATEPLTYNTSAEAKACAESCSGVRFAVDNLCYRCNFSSALQFNSQTQAQHCEASCSASGRNIKAATKYCINCDTTSQLVLWGDVAGVNACAQVCPNRIVITDNSGSTFCIKCDDAGSLETSSSSAAKNCADKCGKIAGDEFCYSCDAFESSDFTMKFSTKAAAQACAQNCSGTIATGTYCYKCEYANDLTFSTEAEAQACAAACSERIAVGKKCVHCKNASRAEMTGAEAKDCADKCNSSSDSENKSFYGDNVCYDCVGTDSSAFMLSFSSTAAAQACAKNCPGTIATGTYCYKCDYADSVTFSTEAEAQACADACAGRIAVGKKCIPCSKASSIELTETEAKICAQKCPNSFSDGTRCRQCDYKYEFTFDSQEQAEVCAQQCPNRYVVGRSCVPCNGSSNYYYFSSSLYNYAGAEGAKKCADFCSDWYAKGVYCYRCDYSTIVTFDTEEEAKECAANCSNRMAQGKECFTCDYNAEVVFDTEAEAKACAAKCSGKRQAVGRSCNRIYVDEDS